MKTLALIILLFSTSTYSYPVDWQVYSKMNGPERLCVKTVKEQKESDVYNVIKSWFNSDLSQDIFNIICEEPVSGQKYDLLRSALMNPFYLNFEEKDDMGHSDGINLYIFRSLFLEIRLYTRQCAIVVKDKNGKNLIEFATELKNKVEKKRQDEISKNGHNQHTHLLKDVIESYESEIREMDRSIQTLYIDPATDCPSWKLP